MVVLSICFGYSRIGKMDLVVAFGIMRSGMGGSHSFDFYSMMPGRAKADLGTSGSSQAAPSTSWVGPSLASSACKGGWVLGGPCTQGGAALSIGWVALGSVSIRYWAR